MLSKVALSYLSRYLLTGEEGRGKEKKDIISFFLMLVKVQQQKLIKIMFKAFTALVNSTVSLQTVYNVSPDVQSLFTSSDSPLLLTVIPIKGSFKIS